MIDSSSNTTKKNEKFRLIEVSNWTLEEPFLKQKVENEKQEEFLNFIKQIIKDGKNKDFICPVMDPSLDEKNNIVYVPKKEPATSKSAKWWNEKFEKFSEQYESRMGTIYEYALLQEKRLEKKEATLKELVDDSKKLGNYWDSFKSRHRLEMTASNPVGDFYDLANLSKIVQDPDKIFSTDRFVLMGGSFYCFGRENPIMKASEITSPSIGYLMGIGWMTLRKTK